MHEIEEAGFKDIFVGTELFKALGVPSYEFTADPIKMQKLKTLAGFLNEHPDPSFVISRIRNNRTNMSSLDYLTSYAMLGKERAVTASKLSDLEKEMKKYE